MPILAGWRCAFISHNPLDCRKRTVLSTFRPSATKSFCYCFSSSSPATELAGFSKASCTLGGVNEPLCFIPPLSVFRGRSPFGRHGACPISRFDPGSRDGPRRRRASERDGDPAESGNQPAVADNDERGGRL